MAGQRAKRTSDRAERAARNLSGFAVLYRSPGSLPDVFLKPRSQVRSLLGAPSPRPRRTTKTPAVSVASLGPAQRWGPSVGVGVRRCGTPKDAGRGSGLVTKVAGLNGLPGSRSCSE